MATSCSGFVPNPDLVGIGTRVNLYVTVFLAAVIPQSEYTTELLNEIYINSVFYCFALLTTVLIGTIQGQLDLYHAVIVMHMTACFLFIHLSDMSYVPTPYEDLRSTHQRHVSHENTGARRYISANMSESGSTFKVKMTLAVQVLQYFMIFIPWSLYVWSKDSQFGSQPECNHLVKYVFYFVTIRVTAKWLRICFIIALSSSLFIMIYVAITSIMFRELFDQEDSEGRTTMIGRVFDVLLGIYAIVTTELVVHRNRPHVQPGENFWGFGQIVSIILIFPIFVEMVDAFRRWKSSSRGS